MFGAVRGHHPLGELGELAGGEHGQVVAALLGGDLGRPDVGVRFSEPVFGPRAEAAQGRLVFENVSFRYHASGPKVLDGINLTIAPGMTVGVLGASGALIAALLHNFSTLAVMANAGRLLKFHEPLN